MESMVRHLWHNMIWLLLEMRRWKRMLAEVWTLLLVYLRCLLVLHLVTMLSCLLGYLRHMRLIIV